MALSLQGSVLPHPQGIEQIIYILQLNPIAKAVFGVASVTFEVCAHDRRFQMEK